MLDQPIEVRVLFPPVRRPELAEPKVDDVVFVHGEESYIFTKLSDSNNFPLVIIKENICAVSGRKEKQGEACGARVTPLTSLSFQTLARLREGHAPRSSLSSAAGPSRPRRTKEISALGDCSAALADWSRLCENPPKLDVFLKVALDAALRECAFCTLEKPNTHELANSRAMNQ
jgi:hypothetical protein